MDNVNLTVNGGAPIPLHVRDGDSIGLAFGGETYTDTTPEYDGAYTATPGREAITVPVSGYKMTQDFVVEPIPSNYGLITYNGSIITVS